jgi:hypothetical protein
MLKANRNMENMDVMVPVMTGIMDDPDVRAEWET